MRSNSQILNFSFILVYYVFYFSKNCIFCANVEQKLKKKIHISELINSAEMRKDESHLEELRD